MLLFTKHTVKEYWALTIESRLWIVDLAKEFGIVNFAQRIGERQGFFLHDLLDETGNSGSRQLAYNGIVAHWSTPLNVSIANASGV